MAARGLFLAITDEEVAFFKARETHAERVEYVSNELEEAYFDSARACETDKAWAGIHSAFDDGKGDLSFDGSTPLKLVVLGGEPIHSEDYHILVLKTPKQVRAAAAALDEMDEAVFRKLYFAIDSKTYDGEIGEDEFRYHWEWLQEVKKFYQRTVASGYSVLFSVDQ